MHRTLIQAKRRWRKSFNNLPSSCCFGAQSTPVTLKLHGASPGTTSNERYAQVSCNRAVTDYCCDTHKCFVVKMSPRNNKQEAADGRTEVVAGCFEKNSARFCQD